MTKQRGTQGPVFGSADNFEGLGIFFDTYKNNRPGTVFPYVMAMVGDGKTSYDKETDGKDQELAGCSVPRTTCFAHELKLTNRNIGERPQKSHGGHQSTPDLFPGQIAQAGTQVSEGG